MNHSTDSPFRSRSFRFRSSQKCLKTDDETNVILRTTEPFRAAKAAAVTATGAIKKLPRTGISSLRKKRKRRSRARKKIASPASGEKRLGALFPETGLWVLFWDSSSTAERLWMEDRTLGERSREDGVLVSLVWLFCNSMAARSLFPSFFPFLNPIGFPVTGDSHSRDGARRRDRHLPAAHVSERDAQVIVERETEAVRAEEEKQTWKPFFGGRSRARTGLALSSPCGRRASLPTDHCFQLQPLIEYRTAENSHAMCGPNPSNTLLQIGQLGSRLRYQTHQRMSSRKSFIDAQAAKDGWYTVGRKSSFFLVIKYLAVSRSPSLPRRNRPRPRTDGLRKRNFGPLDWNFSPEFDGRIQSSAGTCCVVR
ncbi:hypothetical protein ACLOJK_013789 [Asimina triloba]